MRWRTMIRLLVSVFFLAVFWRLVLHCPLRSDSNSSLFSFSSPSASSSSKADGESRMRTKKRSAEIRRIVSPSPLVPRSPFPYRLTNTTRTVGQLARSDKGILLENALLDTGRPLELPIPESLRARGEPGSYIVQSRRPLDDSFRALVKAAGAGIVAYIPNNAYLVRASAAVAQVLAAQPQTQAVLPYEPYFKLKPPLLAMVQSPELEGQGSERAVSTASPLTLNVLLFSDAREATLTGIKELGAQVVAEQPSPFGPVLQVRSRTGDLPALAGLPGVEEMELSHFRVPANDLSRAELGVAADSVTATNYLGLTGSNVLVNLNDTGVDTNHPDLQGRVWFDVPASGWDTNGHGTFVAGIIAGDGSQSLTVTNAPGSILPAVDSQFRGKAPQAMLFSIAAEPGAGSAGSDAYLQQTAAQTNAFISNNSWHYADDSGYDLAAASYDAAVRDALPAVPGSQPLLYVFAAGNAGAGADDGTGGQPDSIQSPATAKNVITVSASELPRFITNETWTCTPAPDTNEPPVCRTNSPWLAMTDTNGQVAAFAGRGNVGLGIEGDFGRFKPDVLAPGTFVISTRSTEWDPAAYYARTNKLFPASPDANYFEVLSNFNDSLGPFYRSESGTSLAAADVSGTLALMQEFFEQRLGCTPSPALMKALLINGARPLSSLYDLHVQTTTNFQGWGLVNLTNSLPGALTNLEATSSPLLFFDQSPSKALATGQSSTRCVALSPAAQNQPLRITLVWTDPPGNPAASLKLVNNLDLLVTNLDTGEVFFGNDIPAGSNFNSPWDTQTAPNLDVVNNVENVYLAPPLSTNYSITVIGRRVNVNAVTAQTNAVAQDYALVASSGDGQVADALTLTNSSLISSDTPLVTPLTNSFTASPTEFGSLLLRQRTGAHTPLPGTNTIPLAESANGSITLGTTNQWHFYVLTNDTDFTNAAFLTFLPSALALPAGEASGLSSLTDTIPQEPDVDLYVSRDPGLTNLDPAVVAAADKSLRRGGTEWLLYSNATPGVYYIGVKSESQEAAEYNFLGLVSEQPFAQTDDQGNELLRGFPAPALIPGGTPACPGISYIFCLAPDSIPIRRVIVTNTLSHPAMGELLGTLTHGGTAVVLNNHSTNGAVSGQSFVYDDSGEGDITGAQPTDGPGSLRDFAGRQGLGQWRFTLLSTNQPGADDSFWLFLERQPDLAGGLAVTLPPGACRQDTLCLPAQTTNLTTMAMLYYGAGPVSLQVYPADANPGSIPTFLLTGANNNIETSLDQASLPPLNPGLYLFHLCNLGSEPAAVNLLAMLSLDLNLPDVTQFACATPMPILDDAVSSSSISVTNTGRIAGVTVGVRIDHQRVSDLALRLISPDGSRVLLAQNRGGLSSEGMGFDVTTTNVFPVSYSGGPEATTNILDLGKTSGSVTIDYDFYSLPDVMHVYYEGDLVFDSGLVSGTNSVTLPYGPGNSTSISIVMNEGGSTNDNTAWFYQVTSTRVDPLYLTFTENTNYATLPIKFASPPFTNFTYSDGYSTPPNGIYYLPEESLDKFVGQSALGQWKLEIADTRAGATEPPPHLLSWQLGLTFQNTEPLALPLTHGVPTTNLLGPGQIQWFAISVPAWAAFATNTLLAADAPLNLLFNQALPPTGTNDGDLTLLANSTAGSCVLETNGAPPLVPGATCYLGVQNTNPVSATFAFEVAFDVTALANGVPLSGTLASGPLPHYFAYDVSSNATAVSFQLLNLSGDANLVAQFGLPFPTPDAFTCGSFYPGTNPEQILLYANSGPVPLAPGRWYLGVFNADVTNVAYSILATEYTNAFPYFITLYSGYPFAVNNPGPLGATDYYLYTVTTNAVRAQFEINSPTADLTLLARKGLPPPSLDSFDYLSANPGTNDELLVICNSSSPVPLTPGDWFLSVVNVSGVPADYSILATEFPEAGTNIVITNQFADTSSFCLTWTSLPGVHYCVQGKTNLTDTNWTTLPPTLTAADYLTTQCIPLPSPFHFFRVCEGLFLSPPPVVPQPVSISAITVSTNGVSLRWIAPTNSQFQVQWTASLAQPEWNVFTNTLTSTNNVFSFFDDGAQTGGLGNPRFYRLLLLP